MNEKIRKLSSAVFGIVISFVIFFMIAYLIPKKNIEEYSTSKNRGVFFAKIKNEKRVVEKTGLLKKEKRDDKPYDMNFKDDFLFDVQKQKKTFTFELKEKKLNNNLNNFFEKKDLNKNKYLTGSKKESKKNIKTAFDYNDVDKKPYILKSVKPKFPFRAKRRGINQGKIVLKFMVNQSGIPENIEVISSTHENIFDESAIKALKEWRFYPGIINGKKVNTILFLPVKYELKN